LVLVFNYPIVGVLAVNELINVKHIVISNGLRFNKMKRKKGRKTIKKSLLFGAILKL